MIEIPWPLFISIYIVFLIGMVFDKINRYLRICIIILFPGFWFSFDATLTPDITELHQILQNYLAHLYQLVTQEKI